MDEAFITASAQGMIRNFGPDAHSAAMERVNRFRRTVTPENVEAACLWLAIASAIERDMEARPPRPPAASIAPRDVETRASF